jgi:hypothetical protein
VLAEGKQHGASEYHVTLGDPRHANVTGDAAYVVVPATMRFLLQGKRVTQTGALFNGGSHKARGRLADCGVGLGEGRCGERSAVTLGLPTGASTES